MNKLKTIRKRAGLTQKELGDMIGTNAGQIHKLEKGLRGLDEKWLLALSKALRCSTDEILDTNFNQNPTRQIPVIGVVHAGLLQSHLEGEYGTMHLPQEISRPETVFGLLVSGNVADQKYPDGTYIAYKSLADFNQPIREGWSVIVHRHIDGKIERTVKQYRRVDGKEWLWTYSSDPSQQQPWEVGNGVEIFGVIVGSYQPTEAGKM